METTWERVSDPADPCRCQANAAHGQCMNKAVAPSEYCMAHGGNKAAEKAEVAETRMYNLGKWRSKTNKFQDHDKLKSLREEIGILRVCIDERMSMCQDVAELLLYSGPLTDMIMKVEKLVLSCNKIEYHLAGVLDKTQALQLGQEMVEIIGKHLDTIVDKAALISKITAVVDDPDTVEAIVDALADCKGKDDVLEGISNDIIATVERLGKTG